MAGQDAESGWVSSAGAKQARHLILCEQADVPKAQWQVQTCSIGGGQAVQVTMSRQTGRQAGTAGTAGTAGRQPHRHSPEQARVVLLVAAPVDTMESEVLHQRQVGGNLGDVACTAGGTAGAAGGISGTAGSTAGSNLGDVACTAGSAGAAGTASCRSQQAQQPTAARVQ